MKNERFFHEERVKVGNFYPIHDSENNDSTILKSDVNLHLNSVKGSKDQGIRSQEESQCKEFDSIEFDEQKSKIYKNKQEINRNKRSLINEKANLHYSDIIMDETKIHFDHFSEKQQMIILNSENQYIKDLLKGFQENNLENDSEQETSNEDIQVEGINFLAININ